MRSEKSKIMSFLPYNASEWTDLCNVMPGGVSSPVRSGCAVGSFLPVMVKGEKSWIEDTRKNRYLDCCMSWGALLHGHAHPEIVEAACQAVREGSTFGTATMYEKELAEAVQKVMPSIEMIRFVSTGTESTMSAVRLARAYTKKDKIIKFEGHYHGHGDQFLVRAGSGVSSLPQSTSVGVPSEFLTHTLCVPFNDVPALRSVFAANKDSIAAIILEPIPANMGVVPPEDGFLQILRDLTLQYNALLIFDEVITGFRVSKGGAQELYGITPDVTCLGKIIGGGFPAAAFGGRKEIMRLLAPLGHVYQAGTLSGNPVAMRAGLRAIQLLSAPQFYEQLQRMSDRLLAPIIDFLTTSDYPACVQRVGSMWTMFFGLKKVNAFSDTSKLDQSRFQRFFHYMLKEGVYIPPAHNEAWFLSGSHSEEEVDHIQRTILTFLKGDWRS
jgi:glutamate-1-semialdehyde 2,1-aminomutase